MAVDAGRALCLDRHLARLEDGCVRLAIPAPGRATLEAECAQVCEGAERAVLKVIVTRGAGGRGYLPDPDAPPTRIVARYPWPDYRSGTGREGVAVRICRIRLGRNPRLAGIKHLNRLEQVLARNEDNPRDCEEGLMLDDRDHVIEGIAANVFAVRGGRVCTPDLGECGVAGIVRALVLEEARALTGREPEIAPLGVEELAGADECFLTNSLIGIWPIKTIEGEPLSTGPIARQLLSTLIEREAIISD
jgi:4-amino-4-deoxychorismate lyase